MTPLYRAPRGKGQDGSVLIAALIILAVVSFLGVAGMRISSTQENMAGYWKNRNTAFQAAEAALLAGEQEIRDAGSVSGLVANSWVKGEDEAEIQYRDMDEWTESVSSPVNAALPQAAAPPRFTIKYLGTQQVEDGGGSVELGTDDPAAEGPAIFKVVALGYGGSVGTRVILQSTFAKQFN